MKSDAWKQYANFNYFSNLIEFEQFLAQLDGWYTFLGWYFSDFDNCNGNNRPREYPATLYWYRVLTDCTHVCYVGEFGYPDHKEKEDEG